MEGGRPEGRGGGWVEGYAWGWDGVGLVTCPHLLRAALLTVSFTTRGGLRTADGSSSESREATTVLGLATVLGATAGLCLCTSLGLR